MLAGRPSTNSYTSSQCLSLRVSRVFGFNAVSYGNSIGFLRLYLFYLCSLFGRIPWTRIMFWVEPRFAKI